MCLSLSLSLCAYVCVCVRPYIINISYVCNDFLGLRLLVAVLRLVAAYYIKSKMKLLMTTNCPRPGDELMPPLRLTYPRLPVFVFFACFFTSSFLFLPFLLRSAVYLSLPGLMRRLR